jgi:uncharacterized protein (TIGR03435 family)
LDGVTVIVNRRSPADRKEVVGGFDFTFVRPPFRGQPDDIQADLNTQLQRQLGLKLEPRKAPLEMIVIENGNPNPIAN